MERFVEIAVRLLGVYGFVLIGPDIVAIIDRVRDFDKGALPLAIILTIAAGAVIPGLLWVMAPRIARAASKAYSNEGSVSFNLSLSDALFLSIVLVGLVVLCSAASNLGEILFWFARRSLDQDSPENGLLMRLQYDLAVREHLAMLAVRSILGGFLFQRAQSIADNILARSGKCR